MGTLVAQRPALPRTGSSNTQTIIFADRRLVGARDRTDRHTLWVPVLCSQCKGIAFALMRATDLKFQALLSEGLCVARAPFGMEFATAGPSSICAQVGLSRWTPGECLGRPNCDVSNRVWPLTPTHQARNEHSSQDRHSDTSRHP